MFRTGWIYTVSPARLWGERISFVGLRDIEVRFLKSAEASP